MSDDVARAIQCAKYNETVQISVTNEEGNAHEITLVATLDHEHGGVQWINADLAVGGAASHDGSTLHKHRLQRHLRTKRWIFPMLNDHHRNQLYEQAIQRAAEQVLSRYRSSHGNENSSTSAKDIIPSLDIGSGTGLLAMMSAKCLGEAATAEIRVTSLEMSSAMAHIARETVASNSLETVIEVVEGHSCEIPPMNPKARLCTSELLEDGLLAEGWIPAMRDAWERHLDPDAVVVPRAAKVYAQLVEGEQGVAGFWGPHQTLDGLPDGRTLSFSLDQEGTSFLLQGSHQEGEGIQIPVHASKLLQDPDCPIRFLSEPMEVLKIRLDSKDAVPSPEGQTRSTTFIPSASGIAHGVLFWWKLDLYGEELTYTTGPNMGPWQDHWHQCLYAFARPPKMCPRIDEGVPVTLQASHNDTVISFDVLPGEVDEEIGSKRPRRSNETPTNLISPLRAWQLNDLNRSRTIQNGIQTLLDQRGRDAVALDLSDFSFCAITAALLGASNVTSLESSSSNLAEATARIAQLSNGLPLSKLGRADKNNFQLIRCHADQLTVDLLGGSPATIVMAEPYYEILEGWVLHEALNFFNILKALKNRNVVSHDTLVLPTYARIMGCAFESLEINGAYEKCRSPLCGFQHNVINQYHALSEHDLSLPSWQYNISELSEAFEIGTLDYLNGIMDQSTSKTVPFTSSGTCNGMLVWVDYGIASKQNAANTLSTRSRSYHQVVRLLKEPAKGVSPADRLCCKAFFGKSDGNMDDYQFELSIERSGAAGSDHE